MRHTWPSRRKQTKISEVVLIGEAADKWRNKVN